MFTSALNCIFWTEGNSLPKTWCKPFLFRAIALLSINENKEQKCKYVTFDEKLLLRKLTQRKRTKNCTQACVVHLTRDQSRGLWLDGCFRGRDGVLHCSYPSRVVKVFRVFNDFDNEAASLYIEIYGFGSLKCLLVGYGGSPRWKLVKDVWFTRSSASPRPYFSQAFVLLWWLKFTSATTRVAEIGKIAELGQ